MKPNDPSTVQDEESAATEGLRVCLTIAGLRCASQGAPLERALKRLDGVLDADVNAFRNRVRVEVETLPRLEEVVRTLERRGYPLAAAEAQVTTWLMRSEARLRALREELVGLPGVTFCRIGAATGRLELGLLLEEAWGDSLQDVCDRICRAAGRRAFARSGNPRTPSDQET